MPFVVAGGGDREDAPLPQLQVDCQLISGETPAAQWFTLVENALDPPQHSELYSQPQVDDRTASEANLAALIEHSQDAIWSIDTRYRLVAMNAAFKHYVHSACGIQPCIGMNFLACFPTGQDEWAAYAGRALRGDRFTVELRNDGAPQIGEIEVSFSPICTNHQITGAAIFSRDITKRQRIESERQQAEAALQAAKDQLQAVLDAVPGCISWFSSDLKYLGINRYLAATFNVRAEDFIGRELGFMESSPGFSEFVREFVSSSLPQSAVEIAAQVDGDLRRYLVVAQKYAQDQAAVFVGLDITDRHRFEEQLRHDALHDSLTGLANRTLLIERLSQAIERSKRSGQFRFAVLFLDLDQFKVVNDSLGHSTGDRLLIALARRLETCIKAGDTIARLGGDEFVILSEAIHSPSDAIGLADRIHQQLQLPFDLDGREVFTTVSIGITLSDTGGDRPEDLLRNADTAMYRAKSQGRARHALFDTEMHARVVALLQLETDLRRALTINSTAASLPEFQLHYQPIVSLQTGAIVGFEALIRWQHPTRGFISPAEFIPVAEDTGLIVPLGRWILSESCCQLQVWQQATADRSLSISVNLSPKQFTQLNLIEQVQQILRQRELEHHSLKLNLKLEITESAIMENPDAAIQMLNQLKALGVTLLMDDFGTGYSSLSYLHRFPFDTVKIDRSFVNRLGSGSDSSAIVKAIVTLAHSLGMTVVAEGVETANQMMHLRALGAEYGQGYFFAAPLTSGAAQQLITSALSGPPFASIASADSFAKNFASGG
jgi:diguanylate cyclase (GGDEF)-like protein/PAS domain S-box-containing protein